MPMSYDDFVALGETKHTSFYDGLAVMNPPNRRHVKIARRLTRLLEDAVPPGYEVLPEAGWLIEPQRLLVPGIMVASIDSPGDDLLRAAPLLVVEVTSRSTSSEDWGRKREVYAEGGAAWNWIVDPEARTISLMRNLAGRFDSAEPLRQGTHRLTEPFSAALDLDAIFA